MDQKFHDPYGHLATALANLSLYEIHQRGTGRTTRMLDQLKAGGCIAVSNKKEASRLRCCIRDRGELSDSDYRFIVIAPEEGLGRMYQQLRCRGIRGPLLFDHQWLLRLVEIELQRLGNSLAGLVVEFGGAPEKSGISERLENERLVFNV
ncbi:MAG: hypothetical protein ACR2QF_00965 [Geminicoccaceae bacterium]